MSYQPKLLDELFTPTTGSVSAKGPLIAVMDEDKEADTDTYTPISTSTSTSASTSISMSSSSSSSSATCGEEGPSMMDLMMQAQQEAQMAKSQLKFEEEKKATKTFGGGFKKGFFGTGGKEGKKKTKTAGTGSISTNDNRISPSSSSSPSSKSTIPTIKKKEGKYRDICS